MAGDGVPLSHHAQAPDLRARAVRSSPPPPAASPSRSAASGTGTTGTRGSATGRSPSEPCWRLGFRDEAIAFSVWMRDRAQEKRGGRLGSARHHVPGRRELGPRRGDPRRLRGVPRLTAGPDRQRRGAAAPARHLRRVPRLAVPARPAGLMVGDAGWTDLVGDHRLALRQLGPARRRRSGRPGADRSRSCTGGSCAGWRSIAPSGSPATARTRLRSIVGPPNATGSTGRSTTTGWNDELQAFVQYTGQRRPRRLAAAHAADGLHLPDRPEVALHLGRDGPHPRVRQPGVPLRPQGLTRRPAGVRGHVLDLHLLVRLGPGPLAVGSTRPVSPSRRC